MRRYFFGFLCFIFFLFGILEVQNGRGACDDRNPELPAKNMSFDYEWLKSHARQLSTRPYISHEGELPESLQDLSWDEHQQITFDHDHALWLNDDDSLFRAEFFHLGLFFKTPITIYELVDGKASEIAYEPDMFDYGKSGVNGESLPSDLGFAGFRFHYHTAWGRDVAVFLGHSYFRAVGSELQYGLSARGLAIGTAMPEPEEFPIFTHFWLEKPEPTSDTATVYALLDSPSATGAYRFDIKPGDVLTMKIEATIYTRKDIERLGIAPLTSMYMVGENNRRADWDWRPEIHDSDGLAMLTGDLEWIWRPLTNPENLRFNAYTDTNPKGFGLLQRDRDFDHYQDDGVFYNKRPSLWVEPINDWGKGWVQLVEIPTLDETFDNIVAFWNPVQPVEAGRELQYSYYLYWGTRLQEKLPTSRPMMQDLAHTVNTFTGLGGIVGQERKYYSKRFVVDFKGGKLPMVGPMAGDDTDVTPVITASEGRVELTSARPLHSINGYRAMFDVVPPDVSAADDSTDPINLRLYLEANGQPLTETWMYEWTPPPADERKLRNP